ncbi:uncharacterized protein ACRADG_008472 [Cochliomyia hominivorax]
MLDGWYCRTLANEQQQATQQNDNNEQNMGLNDDSDSDSQDNEESRHGAGGGGATTNSTVDYKNQYRYLKRKLKFLIYENEFFQDALRSNQRRLLKVSRDRAFLLDRLLQYEKPENTSSESEETEESSEDEATKEMKKRKLEQSVNGSSAGSTRGRKKKTSAPEPVNESSEQIPNPAFNHLDVVGVNQQAQAEVERQLSKRSVMDLIPERAPATVPAEMFSNEPSLDSEPTDHLVDGSSPTHVAAEECVPMEYSN